MNRPLAHISVKRMMLIGAVMAIPLWGVSHVVLRVAEHATFIGHYNRLFSQVRSLESRPPAGMDLAVWRNAVGWTGSVVANVCVHGTIRNLEMAQIVSEMETQLQTEVGPDTLLWVWQRLGHANRIGRGYNRRCRIMVVAPLIGEALRRNRPEGEDAESWRRHVQTIEKTCEDVYYQTFDDVSYADDDGPRTEADILLDDLGKMLIEAESPGAAGRIMERLEKQQEQNKNSLIEGASR